jgi:hypothetical protein
MAVDTRKIERRDGHTAKLPWHMRKLPDHWDADEVKFFRNWMRELASLHDKLLSIAGDRIKPLRRARTIYFKLAYQLRDPIRKSARRAGEESGSSAEENAFDWRGQGWVKAVLRRVRRQQFHGTVIIEFKSGVVTGIHKKRSETISETAVEAAHDG